MKLFDCDYCHGQGNIELGEAPGPSGSIEMCYGICPACNGRGGEKATNYRMMAAWVMSQERQLLHSQAVEEDDIPFYDKPMTLPKQTTDHIGDLIENSLGGIIMNGLESVVYFYNHGPNAISTIPAGKRIAVSFMFEPDPNADRLQPIPEFDMQWVFSEDGEGDNS